MSGHRPPDEVLTFTCPVKPQAHQASGRAYECPDCGELVVGCIDGCSPEAIMEVLEGEPGTIPPE